MTKTFFIHFMPFIHLICRSKENCLPLMQPPLVLVIEQYFNHIYIYGVDGERGKSLKLFFFFLASENSPYIPTGFKQKCVLSYFCFCKSFFKKFCGLITGYYDIYILFESFRELFVFVSRCHGSFCKYLVSMERKQSKKERFFLNTRHSNIKHCFSHTTNAHPHTRARTHIQGIKNVLTF